ncbi:MAG: hypothetical protein E6G95_19440 [Alphaproteobacteria bacterium]|nr:MAG: hypothetical protein E6G95_19440 [Alphaproteobacteria bacterium]
MAMRRLSLLLLLLLAGISPAEAQPAGQRFVSISFHDVSDKDEELETESVTTRSLAQFFDWLKATGWTAISLDDLEAARRGTRPLPDKAILIRRLQAPLHARLPVVEGLPLPGRGGAGRRLDGG